MPIFEVKRSETTAVPSSLANGELAYTSNGAILFIGDPANDTVIAIGGLRTPGTLTANQALVVNSSSGINTIWANTLNIGNNTVNAIVNSTFFTGVSNNSNYFNSQPYTYYANVTTPVITQSITVGNISSNFNAVIGYSNSETGIIGYTNSGWGVYGTSNNAGIGVYGNSFNGIGVYGQSGNNYGVYGQSNTGFGGVFLSTTGVPLYVGNNTNAFMEVFANGNIFLPISLITPVITVGSNLIINTSLYFIGNSTVNSIFSSNSLIFNDPSTSTTYAHGNLTFSSGLNYVDINTSSINLSGSFIVGNIVINTTSLSIGNSTSNSIIYSNGQTIINQTLIAGTKTQQNAGTNTFASNASVLLNGYSSNYLAIGQQTNLDTWLQAGYNVGSNSVPYDILLQPISGNVGIGVTSTSYTLHVNGTISAISNSQTTVNVTSNSGTGIITTSNTGDGINGISNSGAGVWAYSNSGTGVYTSSNTGTGINIFSNSGTALIANSLYGNGIVASTNAGAYAIYAYTPSGGTGVYGYSARPDSIGVGVEGAANGGTGVIGTSNSGIGITAYSNSNYAISAISNNNVGIYSNSINNPAIQGQSLTSVGVYGLSNIDYGVFGVSNTNYGVYGTSTLTGSGVGGVANSGYGVVGQSITNYGVYGTSNTNAAVYGKSNTNYGGLFQSVSGSPLYVSNTTTIFLESYANGQTFINSLYNANITGSFTINGAPAFSGGSGYLHLGGVILEWGSSSVSSTGTLITLPLPFPNGILSLTATCCDLNPGSSVNISTSPTNSSTIEISCQNGTHDVYYICLGY